MMPDEMKNTTGIYSAVCYLLDYAEEKKMTGRADRVFCANALCEDMGLSSFEEVTPLPPHTRLSDVLSLLCDAAADGGIIPDTAAARDRFDTRLMGRLTPRPSDVCAAFDALFASSPRRATDYFYRLSLDSNYIRSDRVERDLRWSTPSKYGDIDISINLSKPEKDPRDIIAARSAPQSGYPKCLLCHENVGFPGNANAPARQTLRQIPLSLGGEEWLMQYSPYVYYNEHCIVLSRSHTPMSIRHETFVRMLDFVDILPHYFIGSNADLPIVGGSILSHDHMQGGRYTFPMERAAVITPISFPDFPAVRGGIVSWPMSVLRLTSPDKACLVALSDRLLAAWRGYTDPLAGIFAVTDGTPHNTVTPIARRRGNDFEMDIVLRNNLTSKEHPLGIFHPHAERHNIKKENIGLIEVMGLAVLPARLQSEMTRLSSLILSGNDVAADPVCGKHASWLSAFRGKYEFTEENVTEILRAEIGKTFVEVLEDSGVYRANLVGRAAFLRFILSVGGRPSAAPIVGGVK